MSEPGGRVEATFTGDTAPEGWDDPDAGRDLALFEVEIWTCGVCDTDGVHVDVGEPRPFGQLVDECDQCQTPYIAMGPALVHVGERDAAAAYRARMLDPSRFENDDRSHLLAAFEVTVREILAESGAPRELWADLPDEFDQGQER